MSDNIHLHKHDWSDTQCQWCPVLMLDLENARLSQTLTRQPLTSGQPPLQQGIHYKSLR